MGGRVSGLVDLWVGVLPVGGLSGSGALGGSDALSGLGSVGQSYQVGQGCQVGRLGRSCRGGSKVDQWVGWVRWTRLGRVGMCCLSKGRVGWVSELVGWGRYDKPPGCVGIVISWVGPVRFFCQPWCGWVRCRGIELLLFHARSLKENQGHPYTVLLLVYYK